jgi:hypothetical protein
MLDLVGCAQRSGTVIYVSPDSEEGKQMAKMDASGRAFQNAPAYSKALQDYEKTHGGSCTNVIFLKLQEPGQIVARYVREYAMEGTSATCGKRTYRTKITFIDAPHTVAKKVEVLGRIVE